MYQITATNGDRDPLDILDDLLVMNRFLLRAAELAMTGEGRLTETEATGFYDLYSVVADGLDTINRRLRDARRAGTAAGAYPHVAPAEASAEATGARRGGRTIVHPPLRAAAG